MVPLHFKFCNIDVLVVFKYKSSRNCSIKTKKL